jgi:hypothetical protein
MARFTSGSTKHTNEHPFVSRALTTQGIFGGGSSDNGQRLPDGPVRARNGGRPQQHHRPTQLTPFRPRQDEAVLDCATVLSLPVLGAVMDTALLTELPCCLTSIPPGRLIRCLM